MNLGAEPWQVKRGMLPKSCTNSLETRLVCYVCLDRSLLVVLATGAQAVSYGKA